MQMFVLDFPLSRPIYFLAFRFLSRLFIFDFFRLFSWRFSSAFFYRDHIYYRLIPACLRSAETWQVWFLALQLFCLSPSVVQFYKAMLHERGDVTESYYYLFHITNLVYYCYEKTIVLDVFLAVSCHLNFTFSRGIMPSDSCFPLPQVAQPAHALQDLYLISPFTSKELLKIFRLIKRCLLRWKKLNEENNGPSAQSVSIMFVQEAFSNYYFCKGKQIQTNCTLKPHNFWSQ